MKNTLIIILSLCCHLTKGQTDTIIKKMHYNNVEYYYPKIIKSIGNIKDSTKTGRWTYFKPDGKILAYGEYLNGKKIGKWKYVDYNNNKYIRKWYEFQQLSEIFIIEGLKLNIYETLKIPNGEQFIYIQYINGKLDKSILH